MTSHDARRAMPIGASADLAPIARTITTRTGDYELRAALTPQLRARLASGVLDLEMDIFTGDRHLVHQLQSTHVNGQWMNGANDRPPTNAATERDAHNRHDVAIDLSSGSVIDEEGAATELSQTRNHQGMGCTDWVLRSRQSPSQTIAQGIAANGVATNVTHTSGASTSSQTGTSYNNGASWSISGSRSRSSTFTAGFARETSAAGSTLNREYRVQWRHSSYDRHCPTDYYGNYQVQVYTDPDFATGGSDGRELSLRFLLLQSGSHTSAGELCRDHLGQCHAIHCGI